MQGQSSNQDLNFSCFFSQAAAEDGRGTGPGARWPRPSPGPPGGHRGQAGTTGPGDGGRVP